MSGKNCQFSRDYNALSEWGQAGIAFLALIDFDGNLLAANLPEPRPQGVVLLGDQKLHYRFRMANTPGDCRPLPQEGSSKIKIIAHPPEREVTAIMRAVQELEKEGYSYLVNICSQTLVESRLSSQILFDIAQARYVLWLEGQFLVFSPETFVEITGNTIAVHPMKGTSYDRDSLLKDSKEMAEHATVVDLLRNDLGMVASRVRVEEYRYVTPIQTGDGRTLYQTSSRITAQMPANWRSQIGQWLPRLLPAGSVTGAPKAKTVEIIRRLEKEPRGFFTGVAVYFDGENLDSAVLIRYIDLAATPWKFRSGAGVTVYSDPAEEYKEIIHKVYFPV